MICVSFPSRCFRCIVEEPITAGQLQNVFPTAFSQYDEEYLLRKAFECHPLISVTKEQKGVNWTPFQRLVWE